jgi:hypothetical protein
MQRIVGDNRRRRTRRVTNRPFGVTYVAPLHFDALPIVGMMQE